MRRIRWIVAAFASAALLMFLAAAAGGNTLTAMCTSGTQTAECASTWYTGPVTVIWQATPTGFSNNSGCVPGRAYQYSSDVMGSLSCTVWWGTSKDDKSYAFDLEVTPPSVRAIPSRPPDANGWYNHPVTVAFGGSAFSLLAFCTPAETYAGPSSAGTALGGGCTDNAGKRALASYPLRYDATPPAVSLSAIPADRGATVQWRATSDLAPLTSVRVVRSSARGARVLSQTSPARTYSDSHLPNRRTYYYTVTATDQAGLTTVQSVAVRPGRRLLTPRSGAHLTGPPMLSWTAIPKATYYNVQVFRRGKVLSAWPTTAYMRMRKTWHFQGHRYRLRRGHYQWYVWPGFGRRSAARYGAQIGSGSFVIN